MRLTTNFSLHEFKCKDRANTPVPEKYYNNVRLLAEQLQILRDDINTNRPKNAPKDVQIPIHVNSGYRTAAYNRSIGGAKESQHLKAKAADITCKWVSPTQMRSRIEKLIKAGKIPDGGLENYPGFVHYDVGPVRRW
jgi:uncharacterized protein YcbK (DUF882 family)